MEVHTRALVRTADGTTIHLNVAWARNREDIQHIQILSDKVGAIINPGDESFDIHETKAGTLSADTRTPKSTNVYDVEWAYFFDVLQSEREHTRNTVEEGLLVQRLINVIYRSTETSKEVAV